MVYFEYCQRSRMVKHPRYISFMKLPMLLYLNRCLALLLTCWQLLCCSRWLWESFPPIETWFIHPFIYSGLDNTLLKCHWKPLNIHLTPKAFKHFSWINRPFYIRAWCVNQSFRNGLSWPTKVGKIYWGFTRQTKLRR